MKQQSQAAPPNATSSHIGAHNERAAARTAAAAARRRDTHREVSDDSPVNMPLAIEEIRLLYRDL